MNLAVISVLLQELLFDNQRITLPGVGTFLLEEIPASFLEESNIMLPPTKKIVFDGKQTKNDGLLENAYARKTGLILEDSKRDLLFLSKKVKEAISNDLKVVIPGFGTLYNNSGEISFEKDKDFDVSPESFGLDAITIEQTQMPPMQPYVDAQEPIEFDLTDLDVKTESEQQEPIEELPQLASVDVPQESGPEVLEPEQLDAMIVESDAKEEVPIIEEGKLQEQQQMQEDQIKEEQIQVQAIPQEIKPVQEPLQEIVIVQDQENSQEPVPAVEEEIQEDSKEAKKEGKAITIIMKLLIALVVILLIVLAVVIFKDSITSMLKHVLYSKEELEIIEKWATL